jgi:hypothetical protein
MSWPLSSPLCSSCLPWTQFRTAIQVLCPLRQLLHVQHQPVRKISAVEHPAGTTVPADATSVTEKRRVGDCAPGSRQKRTFPRKRIVNASRAASAETSAAKWVALPPPSELRACPREASDQSVGHAALSLPGYRQPLDQRLPFPSLPLAHTLHFQHCPSAGKSSTLNGWPTLPPPIRRRADISANACAAVAIRQR